MGIGHVAVGLGLKSAAPRVNAGLLIFAAFLADFLLGCFAIAGWERYDVPADYASGHYLLFTFPWSHGLLPLVAIAALAGLAMKELHAGAAVAAAVLSHYFLDGIVHVRGLPLAGPDSWKLGLGLWRNLPAALSLELLMAAVGIWLYMRAAPRRAMPVYTAILAVFLVTGQAIATTAPPPAALMASWILAPVLISVPAFWIDRCPAGYTGQR